ncbi:MAG: CBS domain-containing protein [Burkholderiaceae bacterium]|nr:CBS domain-containing protein [Burkholderiaceae bacterium]
MDKQAFPILDDERWTDRAKIVDSQHGDIHVERDSSNEIEAAHEPAAIDLKLQQPISSVMTRNLRTVYAEDTVEIVEETLQKLGYASIPVQGSNGIIVGMIGPQELAHFFSENKNPKAVQAWEISCCTTFEVSPDESIEAVSTLMTEKKVEYIAVTELGELIGVVSALDILEEISKF